MTSPPDRTWAVGFAVYPFNSRGFCHLEDLEGRKVFLHIRDFVSSEVPPLEEDDVCLFKVKSGPKGLKAARCRPVAPRDQPLLIEALARAPAAHRSSLLFRLPDALRTRLLVDAPFSALSPSDCRDALVARLDTCNSDCNKDALANLLTTYPEELEVPHAAYARVRDLTPDDDAVWRRAPPGVRREQVRARHRAFFEVVDALEAADHAWATVDAATIGIDALNARLVDTWVDAARGQRGGFGGAKHRDAVGAQMASARRAELATKQVYERRGARVIDVAIGQVTGDPAASEWPRFDLEVRGPHAVGAPAPHKAIDVKNARRNHAGGCYPSVCVPQFKSSRGGQAVTIVGVVSDYQSLEDMQARRSADITILGEATAESRDALSQAFLRNGIRVAGLDPGDARATGGRLPAWMFVLGGSGWPSPEPLDACGALPSAPELEAAGFNPIPRYLASGRPVPEAWRPLIPPTAIQIANDVAAIGSLDHLYRVIMTDGLRRLADPNATYDAEAIRRLLYCDRDTAAHPLGLHDPMQTIDALIRALDALWTHRDVANLRGYDSFEVLGAGMWVIGKRAGHRETLLTWCGGKLANKVACGHWPLVRGREEICADCQWLICRRCHACKKSCPSARPPPS